MKVTLIQAQLEQSAAAANRAVLSAMIQQAPGSDWYVLPETFATGFLGDGDREPETMNGESIQWMQAQAQEHQAAISGSLVISDEDQRLNRYVHVNAQGQVQTHYDKRHLFGYGGEDQRYQAGQERVIYPFEHNEHTWQICPQICYDLRFPVWCRYQNDYEVLVFVANWPIKRVAAWQHLLKARAIENQCYVIGVNRAGPDGKGVMYGGCSAVYGPLGETLVELGQHPAAVTVDLQQQQIQQIREQLPFLKDGDGFVIQ